MTMRIPRKRFAFLIVVLLAITAITAAVFYAKKQRAQQRAEQQPRVNHMPPVLSKVKKLEIVRASMWIIDSDSPPVGVEIEIRNNSEKDAMAIDLVCGEGGITRNGLTDEEHPVVVAKAHGSTTMRMSFSEMTFGAPLVVSAVTWADGSEEGDPKSLRLMHQAREHDRAMIKAQKESEKQKGAPTP